MQRHQQRKQERAKEKNGITEGSGKNNKTVEKTSELTESLPQRRHKSKQNEKLNKNNNNKTKHLTSSASIHPSEAALYIGVSSLLSFAPISAPWFNNVLIVPKWFLLAAISKGVSLSLSRHSMKAPLRTKFPMSICIFQIMKVRKKN